MPEALITLRSSSSKSFLFSIQGHLASALSALPIPLRNCWGVGVEWRSYAYYCEIQLRCPGHLGEGWNPEIFCTEATSCLSSLQAQPPFFLNPCSSFLHLFLCLCALARSLYLCLEWSLLDTGASILPCGLYNTRGSLRHSQISSLAFRKPLTPAHFFVLKLLDGPWILHGLWQIPLCLLSSQVWTLLPLHSLIFLSGLLSL